MTDMPTGKGKDGNGSRIIINLVYVTGRKTAMTITAVAAAAALLQGLQAHRTKSTHYIILLFYPRLWYKTVASGSSISSGSSIISHEDCSCHATDRH